MLTFKKTIGNFGEQLACDFLLKRGYAIIFRNKRIDRREIDIVAKIKKTTVFVEVKTLAQNNNTPAEESLSRRQIELLKSAIHSYCRIYKTPSTQVRFDFISININRKLNSAKIRHYQDIS
jgi:putative endonuclease